MLFFVGVTIVFLCLVVGVKIDVGLAVVVDDVLDIEGVNDIVFVVENDTLLDMIIVSTGFAKAELKLGVVKEDEFVGLRVVGTAKLLANVETFGLTSPTARRTMSWFFTKYLSRLSSGSSTNSDISKKSKERW